jgi:branched-chain amino acid transport system substrate-binding protein
LSGGYGADIGEHSLKGYQLAIDEINEQGGVNGKKIKLLVADHRGDDTKGAITAYHSLKSQGITLILGPTFSPLGQAIAPIACEDKTIVFASVIGIKEFAPTCKYMLNLWQADYGNSKKLGEIVVARGHEKIAIVGSLQSWELEQAIGVKEGVETANGNVVSYVITSNENSDFLTEATKIISAEADAVIFTNYGHMERVSARLRELGSEADFYNVLLTEDKKDAARGAFENTIIISSFTPTKKYIEKFEKVYGNKPSYAADTSYDAIKVLAEAIEETGSEDNDKIVEYILNKKKYLGASGNFVFTEHGGVTKDPIFQIVKDNEIVIYDLKY